MITRRPVSRTPVTYREAGPQALGNERRTLVARAGRCGLRRARERGRDRSASRCLEAAHDVPAGEPDPATDHMDEPVGPGLGQRGAVGDVAVEHCSEQRRVDDVEPRPTREACLFTGARSTTHGHRIYERRPPFYPVRHQSPGPQDFRTGGKGWGSRVMGHIRDRSSSWAGTVTEGSEEPPEEPKWALSRDFIFRCLPSSSPVFGCPADFSRTWTGGS